VQFHPSVALEAFSRAEGKCEICGEVLEPCTDIYRCVEHGWTVTQYVYGPAYTLENAYVVCLDCHIVWYMKRQIQRKLSRKDKPKVLTAEEFADVRAFYRCRHYLIQCSPDGWIFHWRRMKQANESPKTLHLQPLVLLLPEQQDARIREDDRLFLLEKNRRMDEEMAEVEEEVIDDEVCGEQAVLQT